MFAEYKDQAENDGMVYTGIINSFQLEEYGCACRGLNLGAKPVGKPVDAVDSACLRWKRCMNCAQSSIGQVCGGYRITRQNTCANAVGTCKRAACECDMALYGELVTLQYNSEFMNYQTGKCEKGTANSGSSGSAAGGSSEKSSPPGAQGGSKGACCENSATTHFTFYNSQTHDCCSNGDVVTAGNC